jgi:hypothetical protein
MLFEASGNAERERERERDRERMSPNPFVVCRKEILAARH